MAAGRTIARAVAGLAGTAMGLRIAGRTKRWIGPVEVSAAAELAPAGWTEIDVPPLGTATIRSHRGPVKITAMATRIDPARAETGLAGAAGDQLERALDTAKRDAKELGKALARRCAVAGLTGAAATAALTLHRPRDIAGATGAGAALLTATALAAAATADRTAWRTPELDGLLTKAPLLLGDLRTAPDRIATYRDQLADLLATATSVYRHVATLPEPPPADAVRLLHISDIHLSPLAYPLTKALVAAYHVAAVIDTGDLADWGTPPEQLFAEQIGDLGVPYLFVKGNHDSDGIAAAVAKQPNAIVLDATAEPIEIEGLRFAGMADPRFTPDKTTGDDYAAHRVSEAARAWAPHLRTQDVDIAVVHDPAAGRQLAGIVPLVLAGHTHKRSVRRFGDTYVVVQGTTGGSGLRGVQQQPPTPIALSILYVGRTTKRLAAVDEITLGGLGSVELTVVRRTAADVLS